MIRIELDEDEIIGALRHVHRVRQNKKEFNVTDKKFDKNNSSYSVNLMGRLGEVACAKGLGLSVDESINPGGDDGHDLHTPLGKSIQVKTSTIPTLIFNHETNFISDYAILVVLEGDKQLPHVDSAFHIIGITDRKYFFDNFTYHDYGYGQRLILSQDKLHPINEGFNINEIPRLFGSTL